MYLTKGVSSYTICYHLSNVAVTIRLCSKSRSM